jgi:phosphoribosylformylglycinamidine synthase
MIKSHKHTYGTSGSWSKLEINKTVIETKLFVLSEMLIAIDSWSETNAVQTCWKSNEPTTIPSQLGTRTSAVPLAPANNKTTRSAMLPIVHYYRKTEPPHSLLSTIVEELGFADLALDAAKIETVETERCFNVLPSRPTLTSVQTERLEWLLAETFEQHLFRLEQSFLDNDQNTGRLFMVLEFGPRMAFTSTFSSNAVSICGACDIPIQRLEASRRYRFTLTEALSEEALRQLKQLLHDRMTEEEYPSKLDSFDSGVQTAPTRTIPIMDKGRAALEDINLEMGLGFDEFDLDYYTKIFKVRVRVK